MRSSHLLAVLLTLSACCAEETGPPAGIEALRPSLDRIQPSACGSWRFRLKGLGMYLGTRSLIIEPETRGSENCYRVEIIEELEVQPHSRSTTSALISADLRVVEATLITSTRTDEIGRLTARREGDDHVLTVRTLPPEQSTYEVAEHRFAAAAGLLAIPQLEPLVAMLLPRKPGGRFELARFEPGDGASHPITFAVGEPEEFLGVETTPVVVAVAGPGGSDRIYLDERGRLFAMTHERADGTKIEFLPVDERGVVAGARAVDARVASFARLRSTGHSEMTPMQLLRRSWKAYSELSSITCVLAQRNSTVPAPAHSIRFSHAAGRFRAEIEGAEFSGQSGRRSAFDGKLLRSCHVETKEDGEPQVVEREREIAPGELVRCEEEPFLLHLLEGNLVEVYPNCAEGRLRKGLRSEQATLELDFPAPELGMPMVTLVFDPVTLRLRGHIVADESWYVVSLVDEEELEPDLAPELFTLAGGCGAGR